MSIGIYISIQLVRKAIGMLAFMLAAFGLLITMAIGEVMNWIATEPMTSIRRHCWETIGEAWRFFVYNPKN